MNSTFPRHFAHLVYVCVLIMGVGFLHLKIGGAVSMHIDEVKKPALRDKVYYEETENTFFIALKPVFLRDVVKRTFKKESKKQFVIPSLIMSAGQLDQQRMIHFLKLNNGRLSVSQIDDLVQAYLEEAAYEGVNHDIAFSQMCLETGFLKYGGDVAREQNNFCGLGAIGDAEPGLSFGTLRDGVRAHIQHLKAYASTDTLRMQKVDARFDYVQRGSAKNYFDLTGKWAVDPKYGTKLQSILERLYSKESESPSLNDGV